MLTGPLNPNSCLIRQRTPLAQGRDTIGTIVVGIDVSKHRLDKHITTLAERLVFPSTGNDEASLVERPRPLQPRVIGLEVSGGFEALVVAGLAAAGLPVVVVNPAQLRGLAHALGQRAKADPIDAEVIARFTAAPDPDVRALPDVQTQRWPRLLLADGRS